MENHGAALKSNDETSYQAFERLRDAAEQSGKAVYEELVQAHRERLAREREKARYAFASRRRAIERIGLPQVLPEMEPLLIVRVEAEIR